MRTLEEFLIEVGDGFLNKRGASNRIIKVVKLNHKDIEEIKAIALDMTGFEVLELILNIEDKDLRTEILNRSFTVRSVDEHSRVKWGLVILIATLFFFAYVVIYLLNSPADSVSEEQSSIIRSLVEILPGLMQVFFPPQ